MEINTPGANYGATFSNICPKFSSGYLGKNRN